MIGYERIYGEARYTRRQFYERVLFAKARATARTGSYVEPFAAAVLAARGKQEWILLNRAQLKTSLVAMATKTTHVAGCQWLIEVDELDVAARRARHQLLPVHIGQKFGAEYVCSVSCFEVDFSL